MNGMILFSSIEYLVEVFILTYNNCLHHIERVTHDGKKNSIQSILGIDVQKTII